MYWINGKEKVTKFATKETLTNKAQAFFDKAQAYVLHTCSLIPVPP